MNPPGSTSDGNKVPKRRGCLFYGCLTLVVVTLGGLAMTGVGLYLAKKTADKWIENYTDTEAVALPKVEFSPEQAEALQARVDAFQATLEAGETVGELVLTADDLNVMLTQVKDLQGKVFLEVTEDRLKGQVSIPLEDMGPFKLGGRYLNGTATFRAGLSRGMPDVRLQDVQVKGKPLPAMILTQLRGENLAVNLMGDPQFAREIAKFDSVLITNNQIILRSRAPAGTR